MQNSHDFSTLNTRFVCLHWGYLWLYLQIPEGMHSPPERTLVEKFNKQRSTPWSLDRDARLLSLVFLYGSPEISPERMLVPGDKLYSKSAVKRFWFWSLGHDLPLFMQPPNSSNFSYRYLNALIFRFSPEDITRLYINTEAHKAALEILILKAGEELWKSPSLAYAAHVSTIWEQGRPPRASRSWGEVRQAAFSVHNLRMWKNTLL